MSAEAILQLRVELLGIRPPIWRRIQIEAGCTFWDLHVAIQDAMGWTDSHLHAFRVADPATGQMLELGLPDEDGELETEPGWEYEVTGFLSEAQPRAVYEYDFGDGWEHAVVLEEVLPTDGGRYPRCVAGKRACPPEDVGGVPGYEEFLAAIADPDDEEHDGYLEWVGGAFDAERFDPAAARFQDPDERWRKVFGDGAEDQTRAGLEGIPRPQFEGGFTAEEIQALLLDPFGDGSPLRLRTDLPDDVYEAAPIVRDMGRFLAVVRSMAPLKLTQKGNLTKAALAQLVAAGALGPAAWWEGEKTPTEADAPRGTLLRLLAEWTGLTRKQHGKLLLTKRGQAAAEGCAAKGELYRTLIERHTTDLNWAYADPLPISVWLQRGFWYPLYLLQEYGEKKRSVEEYADKVLRGFPMAVADFRDMPFASGGELLGRAFQRRVFAEFGTDFGLARLEQAPGAERGDPLLVSAGPLLKQVLVWERTGDAEVEGTVAEPWALAAAAQVPAEGIVAGPWAQAEVAGETPGEAPAEAVADAHEAGIAEPTIEAALAAFLTEQRRRLRSRQTVRKYEEVVELLQHHLNVVGPEILADEERALYLRLTEGGRGELTFCQVFGPEHIPESLDSFVGFFMIRKVTASPELLRAAGTVSKKLLAWLESAQLLDDAETVLDLADPAAAGRDAARGEEAASLLAAAAQRFAHQVPELPEEDYVDFDHHTIARVEPGKLWLQVHEQGGPVEMGPIRVPARAAQRLQPGWEISCGLGRIGGRWELVEVGNVYPG